jgi:hypothetical protein
MSILDLAYSDPEYAEPVSYLGGSEQIRLTIEARRTAVRAAAEYIASGRSGGRALLDYAEEVEAWILRGP